MDIETLKFPIGRFVWAPEQNDRAATQKLIEAIEAFPEAINAAAGSYNDAQLDTVYRPGGWTLRQVVHHCADSHMNSFIRFKLALTEDKPVIKPYDEQLWAGLVDSRSMPVRVSLNLLRDLHQRWVVLLRSLNEDQLQRSFIHPEQQKEITLREYLAFYAWHGLHHTAHIRSCAERNGW